MLIKIQYFARYNNNFNIVTTKYCTSICIKNINYFEDSNLRKQMHVEG